MATKKKSEAPQLQQIFLVKYALDRGIIPIENARILANGKIATWEWLQDASENSEETLATVKTDAYAQNGRTHTEFYLDLYSAKIAAKTLASKAAYRLRKKVEKLNEKIAQLENLEF